MSYDVTKICARCHSEKLATTEFFRPDRQRLRNCCRECERTYQRAHRDQANAATQRYREKFPSRYNAREKAKKAVIAGKLHRQSCAICGADPAEMHHDNYDRPLDVRWLCRDHHAEAHASLQTRLAEATKRAEQAEAEVAALKARRCGSCRYMGACDQRMNMLGNVMMTVGYCSCWAERGTK